jgi:hypothetical protein
MGRDLSSETPPADPDVVQGLCPGPLLEGLLAQLQGDSTPAFVFLAHDTHAPLVLDAGGVRARRAKEIAVEVGQAVVVALDALDELAVTEPETTAGTHATLGVGYGGSRRVLADLAGGRHVSAGANPCPQVHQIDASAGAAGHRPYRAPYVLDFISTLAVEGEASRSPGVCPGRLRYSGGRGHKGPSLWPRGPGVVWRLGSGAAFFPTSRISQLIAFVNRF